MNHDVIPALTVDARIGDRGVSGSIHRVDRIDRRHDDRLGRGKPWGCATEFAAHEKHSGHRGHRGNENTQNQFGSGGGPCRSSLLRCGAGQESCPNRGLFYEDTMTIGSLTQIT